MPLLETESIVLKSYDLAEADRIVVFFTRSFGLVRGVAKGIKRTKSKFGSSLEPFTQVRLGFFQKDQRELVSIHNVELIRSEFRFAADPERLKTFSYIAELLNEFSQPHDPNETLYRMVKACFETETDSSEADERLRFYFEAWLLRLSGYLPDWDQCSRCRRSFSDVESALLTVESHLLCQTCDVGRGREQVSSELRMLMKRARKMSPEEFLATFRSGSTDIGDLRNILRPILMGVTGRKLMSAWASEGTGSK